MKETMTIHEALSELKILDSRINAELNIADFVTANRHSNTKIKGESIQDYHQNAKDAYKSIRSLISRRDAIKRAVSKSNAWTIVEVAGKRYTIAEAIEMKNHGVEYLRALKDRLKIQLDNARKTADRENSQLDAKADAYIQPMLSGADKKNLSDEAIKQREFYITSQTVELVDPLDAAKTVRELEQQIYDFESKVDSALSVSNALTTIEIEYETF